MLIARHLSGLVLSLCLAAALSGCAHQRGPVNKELWVPVDAQGPLDVEGRELWIDVELSGYTRQLLEPYSDYEAQQEDETPRPKPRPQEE